MARFRRMRVPVWRRMAAASWNRPGDPTILGTLTLDARPVSTYIDAQRAQSGARVTLTHVVGRAVALGLRECPELNGRLRGTRFYQRDTIDVFFQIVAEEGADLSGAKIERADEKSTVDIARELAARAEAVRSRKDTTFAASKRLSSLAPGPLLGFLLRAAAWCDAHGIRLPGVTPDPFGSVMVTNVGMFGIDTGYAPLFPVGGPPIVVLVGAVGDEAACEDGRVVARPTLRLHATFDHRFVDGYHAGVLARAVKRLLADPGKLDPMV